MAYLTSGELRTYLNVDASTDDALLTALIAAAQAAIEKRTHRDFEVSADTTRYLSMSQTDGLKLILDEDLCQITSVKTNLDNGSSGVTIPSTEYVTLPRNETPYYALRLRSSSDYAWEYTDDPEDAISITGRWGYSVTPPTDIVMACRRLAAYYYRQRDAQVFDTTAMPDAGVMLIPQGIPRDVDMMLEPYILRVAR